MYIIIFAALILAGYWLLNLPKFGRLPAGKRLEAIRRSPNYRDGRFSNLSVTPDLTEGVSYYAVLAEFLKSKPRLKPSQPIPSRRTDLLGLSAAENVVVWLGHSSYFMQLGGKKILVDPVLSGAASPLRFTTRSFEGSDAYTAADIPEIDYLFLSHDHWDHLDYDTLTALKPKIKTVITGLGTGAHLEHWGFDPDLIFEKDWNGQVDLGDGFTAYTVAARHFSGRSFKRNQSLWLSFVLQAPGFRIFIGGDSGYDSHFAGIGEKFGPFDLAILECGQYDKSWKYIHLMPDEFIEAAKDLRAEKVLPVHWGKFALGNHDWDEPIRRVTALAATHNVHLLTPMIGEKANLSATQDFEKWWEAID